MTDLWRQGPDAAFGDLMAQLSAAHGDAWQAPSRKPSRRPFGASSGVPPSPSGWPTSPRPGLSTASPARSAHSPRAASAALTDSILLQLARDGQLGIGDDPQAAAFCRTRHGETRRRRAQLLERHRPDPALRPRRAGPRRQRAGCRAISCGATRLLVQLMSEASADGYIFRTDLRLRPDPGSTPACHVGAGGGALLRKRRPGTGNAPP